MFVDDLTFLDQAMWLRGIFPALASSLSYRLSCATQMATAITGHIWWARVPLDPNQLPLGPKMPRGTLQTSHFPHSPLANTSVITSSVTFYVRYISVD